MEFALAAATGAGGICFNAGPIGVAARDSRRRAFGLIFVLLDTGAAAEGSQRDEENELVHFSWRFRLFQLHPAARDCVLEASKREGLV